MVSTPYRRGVEVTAQRSKDVGRVGSQSSLAPFLFDKLVITDDDTYLDTPQASHSIGEIKLVFSRLVIHKRIGNEMKFANYLVPPQKVHESSKKAIAHQVNYGNEIPAPNPKKYLENLETLVTFIFRYRPLEILRANDIVPRNLYSGVKKAVESGPETDSDEDRKREKALLAEVERCQAEVERIRKARRRHSKDSDRPIKKLKKEDKLFFTPGEIIDLT